jgi:hypothetical protein
MVIKFVIILSFILNFSNLAFSENEWITIKKDKKQKVKQIELESNSNDKDPPKILISDTIAVNSSNYKIEGRVLDKSKKLFIMIDGETILVDNGKFVISRFSPVNETIELVAIDQWGNKSDIKTVNIILNSENAAKNLLDPLNPEIINSNPNIDRVAIIIGIEKYKQAPLANYANNDAKYFYEYSRKAFGISDNNLKLLTDDSADLVGTISALNKWLPGKINKNKTELIVFFAGHGLASNDGKELYLLPQDSDPDLLSRTALSRSELFETILKFKPKSVTMFFDACYSGQSRENKTLIASARPVRIVADEQDTPNNFTIFSASQLDQISSGLKEAKHGIFSYYLMKGLEGKADANNDKDITNGELLAYMDQNVAQKASELGRQQNPSLAGDPDKILMSYR